MNAIWRRIVMLPREEPRITRVMIYNAEIDITYRVDPGFYRDDGTFSVKFKQDTTNEKGEWVEKNEFQILNEILFIFYEKVNIKNHEEVKKAKEYLQEQEDLLEDIQDRRDEKIKEKLKKAKENKKWDKDFYKKSYDKKMITGGK